MLELKRPFSDGTSHLVFEPLELLEKLSTIIPRPRTNQLIYHGVLGPNAAWRREVVALGREVSSSSTDVREHEAAAADDVGAGERDINPRAPRRRSYTWAELMARAFLADVLDCPRCHGRMRVISTIDDSKVVRKILDHLGLSTDVPSADPARCPRDDFEEIVYDLDWL